MVRLQAGRVHEQARCPTARAFTLLSCLDSLLTSAPIEYISTMTEALDTLLHNESRIRMPTRPSRNREGP